MICMQPFSFNLTGHEKNYLEWRQNVYHHGQRGQCSWQWTACSHIGKQIKTTMFDLSEFVHFWTTTTQKEEPTCLILEFSFSPCSLLNVLVAPLTAYIAALNRLSTRHAYLQVDHFWTRSSYKFDSNVTFKRLCPNDDEKSKTKMFS